MSNLRTSRLSPTGLADGAAPTTPPARRKMMIALGVLVPVVLLALAWFDGGEEAIHAIAEPIVLPVQGQ